LDVVRSGVPFDAVLLDLDLPRMSGLDVLRALREQWPHVPVLVVSGNLTGDVVTQLQDIGQNELIDKPFDVLQLVKRLRLLLDGVSTTD
jgi:DNA-binding response OmpR family regulator